MIIAYSRENWVLFKYLLKSPVNKLKNSKNDFTKPDMSI